MQRTAVYRAVTVATGAFLAMKARGFNFLLTCFDQADIEILWPPSSRSAPALLTIATAFALFTLYIFCQSHSTAEQQRVMLRKKKLVAAQLSQAMRWDQDEDKSLDGDEKDKEMKPKEKKPPEITELFEMLFDDVEERHVIDFGISASSPDYMGVLQLFKERLAPDIEEAARCTVLANGLPLPAGLESRGKTEDLKRITLFRDGTKLRELIELYQKKIRKTFGPLLPPQVLKAAKAARDATDREQRRGGLAILFGILRPHLPLYSVSALLMAFDSAIGAATWHSVASLLDGIDAGTMTTSELQDVFIRTFFTFVLCISAHLTSCSFTARVAGRFSNAIKSEVLRGVLRKDTVFFDVYPCGVIQERLNHDSEDLSSKCFHLPMDMLHHALMIISNALAVYRMRPELLWLTIAPIPFIALMQKLFIRKMEQLHRRGRKVSERVVADTNETIKELRTVRAFAMEGEEAETYAANSQYRAQIQEQTSVIHHCLFIAPLVMMFVATRLLATYMGGLYVADKLITVGMAIQIGNAADHLQHCMRRIVDLLPELFKVFGPVGRICDAISSVPAIEPYPGMAPKIGALTPHPVVGQIDFVNVDFTFPSEPLKQILHQLSFTAKPGEKIAFVGPTGCGKSTAIQLIQRFYTQSSGQVLLDGLPIEDFDVHFLRRQISVVAQDNVLFSTTIRENVTYGLPRAQRDALSDADVEAACRKANAWDFIQGFPRKLETYCGERGVKLSGGQKQRLAIARAIIRKPTICLLDEATSALDSRSELVVQRALDQMIEAQASGCTLMIAHRLSTVKNCDRILVMDKGHVVESGTHDELLEIEIEKADGGGENAKTLSGIYHDLWNVQMGGKQDESAEIKALRKQLAEARESLQKQAETCGLEPALNIKEEPIKEEPLTSASSDSSSDGDNEPMEATMET